MSNSEGGSDSEVEMQARRQTREQITPTQHHHSSTNSKTMKDYAKHPIDKKKPFLQFVTAMGERQKNSGGSRVWLCHVCEKEFRGSYTRVRSHFLGEVGHGVRTCPALTDALFIECQTIQMECDGGVQTGSPSFPSSQSSMPTPTPSPSTVGSTVILRGKRKVIGGDKGASVESMFQNQARETCESSIAKFFFAHAIPFHVARSSYFKQMVKDLVTVGPSFVPPGDHKLRTTLLDKEYSKVNVLMEEMRQTWMRTGCSIVMDGWTDCRRRPLINVIVTCPAGSYFLRAVDCSGRRKDADFQFSILRDAIEEVGAANVVQVITDSARVCKSAGLMVEGTYRHIFWTPCCVHALNNALKDIGKMDWVKKTVAEAREIQMFICNHHTSLALFRTFSKKEFLKPVDTRYATYFILLERMLEVHEPLQLMMVNAEWTRWPNASSTQGKSIKQKILDDDWWANVRYICSFISPIVDVIRYADTDSPSLGEIYETFDTMLGKIRQVILAKDPTLDLYEQHIRPIVTRRWNTMNTPLHMAAFALNPKWYAPRDGRVPPCDDAEVLDGFTRAIEKIYPAEQASILRSQFLDFANLNGPNLSKPQARLDRAILAQGNPIGWWTYHGRDTPQLKILATRLLAQVASSSAAERNWSTYGFIHSVKRNRLTSRRAEKLVAVHSALRLQDRQTPEYRQTPALRWDIDPEDAAQIDEEETAEGLVGVPLAEEEHYGGSDSEDDSDFDAVMRDD